MTDWIGLGLVVVLYGVAFFLGRIRNRPGPGGADPKETRE